MCESCGSCRHGRLLPHIHQIIQHKKRHKDTHARPVTFRGCVGVFVRIRNLEAHRRLSAVRWTGGSCWRPPRVRHPTPRPHCRPHPRAMPPRAMPIWLQACAEWFQVCIEGSNVSFVGNIGTIDGSKEATNGSSRAHKGSKVTIKGNIGTFNGPKETTPANDTPHDGPKETIEGSKVSFACNIGTIKGNIGTIKGNVGTIKGNDGTIKVTTRTIHSVIGTIERGRGVFLANVRALPRWRRAKLPPRPARDFPALPETRYLLAVAADSWPHKPLDARLLGPFARFDNRGACTLNLVAVVDGVNSR